MGAKKSTGKAKVVNGHPELSVKTAKLKKSTTKPDSKPRKAVGKEDVPGADLFELIKKRNLLSVAAPLASRKRAAEFFDSESKDGSDDQQPIAAPKSKKAKGSKESTNGKTEPSATRPTTTGNKQVSNDAGPQGKSKKSSEKTLAHPTAEIDSPEETSATGNKSFKPAREEPIVTRPKQDSQSKKGHIQSNEVRAPAKRKPDHIASRISATKRSAAILKQQPSEKEAAPRSKKSKQVSEKARDVPAEANPVDASDQGSTASDPEQGSAGEEDQTAALLKGFESSESEDSSGDEGFEQGRQIPKVPSAQKTQTKLARIKEDGHDEPGVLYVGRIPHGFYEGEMRAYFSQFGDIKRLRLSRNRLTGRSKHYAFIEFASSDVAQIVADTMNNYLLFGHILKCRIVPKEQVHEELWKGANRKYRVIPRNKIAGKLLEAPKSKDVWAKKIQQESKRRRSKLKGLKSMGYEFELPVLKTVDQAKLLSDEEESEEMQA